MAPRFTVSLQQPYNREQVVLYLTFEMDVLHIHVKYIIVAERITRILLKFLTSRYASHSGRNKPIVRLSVGLISLPKLCARTMQESHEAIKMCKVPSRKNVSD